MKMFGIVMALLTIATPSFAVDNARGYRMCMEVFQDPQYCRDSASFFELGAREMDKMAGGSTDRGYRLCMEAFQDPQYCRDSASFFELGAREMDRMVSN